MTSTMKPLPFPGDPSPGPPYAHNPQEELFPPQPRPQQHLPTSASLSYPHQSGEFFSTTTAPLRDHEDDFDSSTPYTADRRRRKTSAASVGSSVLEKGRSKAVSQAADRPSSFFGAESATGIDAGRPSAEWNGPGASEGGTGADWRDGDSDYEGGRGRAGSFFGMSGPNSTGVENAFPAEAGEVSAAAGLHMDGEVAPRPGMMHERRSSFYGLDSHIQPQPSGSTVDPSRDSSPGRQTPPSQSIRNSPVDRRRNANGGSSGSGSGSYSSHEFPNRPRYSQAPYAASRAASLYGIAASNGGDLVPPPPAPLLDQSHLRPGDMASLLSHDKTLELYRQNAKKTNDPNIQFEFCTFVMEVVAELEQATAMARLAAGKDASPAVSEHEAESKKKQQALVAESIALLGKLAQRGHVKSQYFLADCYTQGIGVPKGKRDYDKAFPLFLLAARHGHADASFRAAQCLEHGWGCRKDQSKAVSLYRRAAVLSHPGSMHRLGLAEINGEIGLSKRPKDGVQWLKRAAELANQVDPPQPQSLHELAILHEKGIDNVVFQDEDYAAELLARAAELQFAPSAYKLGECYEYGRMGCPQDAALSIHYYNIAAQQNHPAACFALTAWYLVGSPGVLPQSDTEAYLWAKKSAEMGFAKAEYACGYFTENGMGTYKDAREALEWFRKAASHGDKRAQDRLRMAGQPQPAQKPVPHHPVTTSSMPGMPLPSSNSASTHYLKKEQREDRKGKQSQPRSGSVDRLPSPPPKPDVKGKGKEKALPSLKPPMVRQRSHSQPTPVPLDAVAPGGDFAPLSYGDVPATVGGRPAYQQGYPQERPFVPLQPEQARMPLRQQVNRSPILSGDQVVAKKAEREKVLQRKKGVAEEKDCVIM
ncbi:SPOSA6832_04653 [Sporobolomyces salmonicolor]|uniref:SPOSA6832_04653-mRNA-1:cds n=1 Tax=Sporidiobolus salmonicolor TaxID=5005 RepID=A0A0D6ESJ8_SPOSA|nr:SPOSA6832_04653 [Sporobolomyces salmonicolor]